MYLIMHMSGECYHILVQNLMPGELSVNFFWWFVFMGFFWEVGEFNVKIFLRCQDTRARKRRLLPLPLFCFYVLINLPTDCI